MSLVVVVYLMESWESFCTERDKPQSTEWPQIDSFPFCLMLKNSFTMIDSSKPSSGGRGPRQKLVRTVNRCGYWFRVSTDGSALAETIHFSQPLTTFVINLAKLPTTNKGTGDVFLLFKRPRAPQPKVMPNHPC